MVDELRRAAAADNVPKVRIPRSELRREVSSVRHGLEIVLLVVLLAAVFALRTCPALQPLPDHPVRAHR
jgi:hypothetical protein